MTAGTVFQIQVIIMTQPPMVVRSSVMSKLELIKKGDLFRHNIKISLQLIHIRLTFLNTLIAYLNKDSSKQKTY